MQYFSGSNAQITITVTPLGGSPAVFGPSVCTVATCTISFTANPGVNTLAFRLVDGSANTLSQYSAIQIVQPDVLNTLRFSANPVVSSVSLTLSPASLTVGTRSNLAITVNALDAAGNTIAGQDQYVDASGNPLVLQLTASTLASSTTRPQGHVSIVGSSRVVGYAQTTPSLSYDGGCLASAALSITASRPLLGSLSGANIAVGIPTSPTIIEYSAGISGGSAPQRIVSGPDGNLWFTEYTGNRIGRSTRDGLITQFASPSAGPLGITSGPDGNLWFTEYNVSRIGRITTAGVTTEFSAGITASSFPAAIVSAPDGNLWFTEPSKNKVARITTAGVVTEFSAGITPGAKPTEITVGPDGNLWFTENGVNQIGRVTLAGVVTEFSAGITAPAGVVGIASGADGNLWFTELSGNRIGRITPVGNITEFSAGISGGAQPYEITSGPDGNLWFTEVGKSAIARVTTSGVITEYTSGISGSAQPQGITTGPDGNLWFTESTGNRIAKAILPPVCT